MSLQPQRCFPEMPCIRFQTGCLYLAKSWRLVKLMVRWSRHVIQQCEHETRGYLTTLLRGPAAIWALRLAEPASCAAAAGPTEASSAERWERRLGGLLEGEGGGMKGWLQSQNHAAGCGGHDGARCELVERRSWGSAPPPSSRRSTLLSETTPFFATDS